MIMAVVLVSGVLTGGLFVSARREAHLEPGRTGSVSGKAGDAGRPPIVSASASPVPSSTRSVISATASPAGTQTRKARRHSGVGVAIPGIRLIYDAPASTDRKLDRVAAMGAGWLRFDAAWPEIEIERGRFDYSRVDRALNGARARGLRVVLVLGGTAAWARPAGADWNHGPTTATARAGFAAFAATTARRYRDRVGAYEIWNEPNLPGSWAPQPDPAAYFALLRDAYAGIHRADSDAVVLSGGTGGGLTGIGSVRWYTDLYAAGLSGVSDGVAVHPYPDALSPADSGEMSRARRVRALMDAHGDRDKQLWGTETGTATGGEQAASEKDQAALVVQLHRQWQGIHTTGPLLYYTLYDFGGADREDHFGLLRADGSAKPAYASLRDVVIG